MKQEKNNDYKPFSGKKFLNSKNKLLFVVSITDYLDDFEKSGFDNYLKFFIDPKKGHINDLLKEYNQLKGTTYKLNDVAIHNYIYDSDIPHILNKLSISYNYPSEILAKLKAKEFLGRYNEKLKEVIDEINPNEVYVWGDQLKKTIRERRKIEYNNRKVRFDQFLDHKDISHNFINDSQEKIILIEKNLDNLRYNLSFFEKVFFGSILSNNKLCDMLKKLQNLRSSYSKKNEPYQTLLLKIQAEFNIPNGYIIEAYLKYQEMNKNFQYIREYIEKIPKIKEFVTTKNDCIALCEVLWQLESNDCLIPLPMFIDVIEKTKKERNYAGNLFSWGSRLTENNDPIVEYNLNFQEKKIDLHKENVKCNNKCYDLYIMLKERNLSEYSIMEKRITIPEDKTGLKIERIRVIPDDIEQLRFKSNKNGRNIHTHVYGSSKSGGTIYKNSAIPGKVDVRRFNINNVKWPLWTPQKNAKQKN